LAGRRECYGAAFSLAKLLLTLTGELDPTFAALHVDFYALRSGKGGAAWILEHGRALGLDPEALPSAAFTRALAMRATGAPKAQADAAMTEAACAFPAYVAAALDAGARTPDSSDPLRRLSVLCAV